MTRTHIDKTCNTIKTVLDETLTKYLSIQAKLELRLNTDSEFFGSDEYTDMKSEQLYLGKKHQKLTDALNTLYEWL